MDYKKAKEDGTDLYKAVLKIYNQDLEEQSRMRKKHPYKSQPEKSKQSEQPESPAQLEQLEILSQLEQPEILSQLEQPDSLSQLEHPEIPSQWEQPANLAQLNPEQDENQDPNTHETNELIEQALRKRKKVDSQPTKKPSKMRKKNLI